MTNKKQSILILVSFLYCSYILSAEVNKTIEHPQATIPISITPNFNNYNYPTNNHNTYNHFTFNFVMDALHNAKEHIENIDTQEIKQQIKKILWEKKFIIAGYTLAGCYGIVSALLLYDYHFLQSGSLWARWKSECSFQDLCTIAQQDLAKELILAVQQRNLNKKDPTDFVQPLTSFMKVIDEEIKRIKRYIFVATHIKKTRLIIIFPTNEKKIELANILLQRAHFIKHVFLSWLAEHNLTNKSIRRCLNMTRWPSYPPPRYCSIDISRHHRQIATLHRRMH